MQMVGVVIYPRPVVHVRRDSKSYVRSRLEMESCRETMRCLLRSRMLAAMRSTWEESSKWLVEEGKGLVLAS